MRRRVLCHVYAVFYAVLCCFCGAFVLFDTVSMLKMMKLGGPEAEVSCGRPLTGRGGGNPEAAERDRPGQFSMEE